MSSADLEAKLVLFAESLIAKAGEKDTPIETSIKIFKELREFYITLTKDPKAGDNPGGGRSSSMSAMRKRIALVDGGDDGDGRA